MLLPFSVWPHSALHHLYHSRYHFCIFTRHSAPLTVWSANQVNCVNLTSSIKPIAIVKLISSFTLHSESLTRNSASLIQFIQSLDSSALGTQLTLICQFLANFINRIHPGRLAHSAQWETEVNDELFRFLTFVLKHSAKCWTRCAA